MFDAGTGVAREEAHTSYEWQRLTAEIHPGWRVRDGNTLTWLPSVGRFVMVAGWNGYQEPVGFSSVPPDSVYPMENTTDEVWSSADGVNWTVELGPGTDEPPWSERVLQVSGVYDGKLWMVGGQDGLGDPAEYVYHNDVWNTEDGVHWTEVAPDGPASETRWAGCGVLDGLVEFRGELWLVGCAKERGDAVGHSMSNEVWSSVDGITWTKHAEPPWVGKIWPNVVVWDDKLWILFGYTYGDPANGWTAGNANEAWYSEDGETWSSLRPDAPVPGSHAQGVAVTDDFLLFAGGNYSFGFGAGEDTSAWRLVPFRGDAVGAWVDRGADALSVAPAADENRPVWVADAFGEGRAGVQFDGSTSVLSLATPDEQAAGRSVFWVARAPYLPPPWAWTEVYATLGTLVGGPIDYGWLPRSSVGLSDGQVALLNLNDDLGVYGEPVFTRVAGGAGLQEGPGEARMAGLTHAPDGTVQVFVDGVPAGAPTTADYGSARAWSRLGGSLDDAYYGPNTRFAGTVGVVIVLDEAADEATVARIHTWARGRFPVP